MAVVAPFISMMHFDSRDISRELNGRTRTATFTEDILADVHSICFVLPFSVLKVPNKLSYPLIRYVAYLMCRIDCLLMRLLIG